MLPIYQDGDWLVVRWHAQSEVLPTSIKLGAVVVIERDERPGIYLIKRLQKHMAVHIGLKVIRLRVLIQEVGAGFHRRRFAEKLFFG